MELSVFHSVWSGVCHVLTLEGGEGISSAWFTSQRWEGIASQGNAGVVKGMDWGQV